VDLPRPFNLQPSEFGRLALALILAMYFGENRRGARNYGDLVIAGLFFVVHSSSSRNSRTSARRSRCAGLLRIAYLAGLRLRLIAIVAMCRVLLAPVAWKVALKDYQKSRIDDVPGSGERIRARRLSADSGADSPSGPAASRAKGS
jgi:rod shape determining protein RodA